MPTKAEQSKGPFAKFIDEHLAMYLSSGGTRGHLHILRGGTYLATHLLLKHVGRKSGKTYITPLTYFVVGGEAVLVASKGGADSHPAWYLNLTAGKDVYFQIATQAFRGTWREPEGEERAKVWEFAQAVMPDYTAYQASTTRQIPLVMLRASEEVDIFRPV